MVNDEDVGSSEYIASYSLPADSLATGVPFFPFLLLLLLMSNTGDLVLAGYRHIPLELATGETIELATLFVHIELIQEQGPPFAARTLEEGEAMEALASRSSTLGDNRKSATGSSALSGLGEVRSNSLGLPTNRLSGSRSSTSNMARRGSNSEEAKAENKRKKDDDNLAEQVKKKKE